MPSRFILAFRTPSILLVDMCHRQKPVLARNSHTNLLAIAQTLPKQSLSIAFLFFCCSLFRSLYPLPCLCNMPISPQSHGFDAPHQISCFERLKSKEGIDQRLPSSASRSLAAMPSVGSWLQPIYSLVISYNQKHLPSEMV